MITLEEGRFHYCPATHFSMERLGWTVVHAEQNLYFRSVCLTGQKSWTEIAPTDQACSEELHLVVHHNQNAVLCMCTDNCHATLTNLKEKMARYARLSSHKRKGTTATTAEHPHPHTHTQLPHPILRARHNASTVSFNCPGFVHAVNQRCVLRLLINVVLWHQHAE